MNNRLAPNNSSNDPHNKPTHSIARCRWDTVFDDPQQAQQLQEYLSQWSNTALNGIIEQAFEQYCPAGYVWRIDTLELDLGEIDFADLQTELPKRLQASLSEQLKRLLLNAGRTADRFVQAAPGDSTLVDPAQSLNAYLYSFLRDGVVPWWYTGKQSNRAILLQQLHDAPRQVAAIIRKLGHADAVRKRIVRQYQSALKNIVKALEPHHHDYIVDFAEQLIGLQAATQQPKSDRAQFTRQSWLWILTHLLVERGSLFNTVVFVESTLRQMAQYYQLDYDALLQQLVNAAQSLEYKGHTTPQFIQALLAVQQKALSRAGVTLAPEPEQNYWQVFTRILTSGQQSTAGDSSHLGELFTLLAAENPGKMTALLKKHGQEAKVRQKLAAQLSLAELSQVVFLLAPQDHLFIVAHAQRSSEIFAEHKADGQLVWGVILAYLLKNSGSYFNRRQFVNLTLSEISQAQGIDYLVLLDMLTVASLSYQNQGQRLELLAILQDLKQQTQTRELRTLQLDNVYCQALADYLATGQAPKAIGKHYLPVPGQLFCWLLYRHPQQLAVVIAAVFKTGPDTGKTFKVPETGEISRHSRIRRLLDLIQPADFLLVLRTIEPRAAEFAGGWMAQLVSWQRRQRLPSLRGFDLYYQLHSVILTVLLGGLASGFTIARFLSAFFAELSASHGIDSRILAAEIGSILATDTQNRLSEQANQALLHWVSNGQNAGGPEKPDGRALTQWPLPQKILALVYYLRGDKAGLQRLGLAYEPQTALPSLFAAILPSHADLLVEQLRQQSDGSVLAQALLEHDIPQIRQWLNALWPNAAEFLGQWQSAIALTGLWQGSATALQQKLHNIFWLSVLDQALTKRGTFAQGDIDALLANVLQISCLQLQLGLKPLLERLNSKECFSLAPLWQKTIVRLTEHSGEPVSAFILAETIGGRIDDPAKAQHQQPTAVPYAPFSQDGEGHYLDHPFLFGLCQYLLIHGRPPLWLQTAQPLDLAQMLTDLLQAKPQLLRRIISSLQHLPAAMYRLHNLLDYQALLTAVAKTNPELAALALMLAHVQQGLLQLRFAHIDPDLLAAVLRQKTLQAWLSGDWQGLSAQHIVIELSGELMRRYSLDPALIEAEFKRNEQHFPAACRLAVMPGLAGRTTVSQQPPSSAVNGTVKPIANFPSTKPALSQATEQTMPMQISNAGLVLLQGFIRTYFNRLELVKDHAFISDQARRNAVHHLQYLATGLAATEEQHLVLNKLLCGLSPSEPIELGIELTAEHKQIGDSLIQAVINYWSAIGSSSLDGFRGNWLVRNGLLSQSEDRWNLLVEKRPYDLLLQSAPFSYNQINLPWMGKPLYVTWTT